VIAIKANKQANKGKGTKHIWVPKEIISTMKSTIPGQVELHLDSEREVRSPKDYGNLETWQNRDVYHGIHHIGSSLLPSGLVHTLDPNFPARD
jgi:hypothetical protein